MRIGHFILTIEVSYTKSQLHSPKFGLFCGSCIVFVMRADHVVGGLVAIVCELLWLELNVSSGSAVVHSKLLSCPDGV